MVQSSLNDVGFLDRVICAIAPKIGHERLCYRELNQRYIERSSTRSYDIARRGRSTQGWRAAGTSATAEIAGALSLSRSRARDLVRNNPYATSALNKLQAKIVGTGINPRIERMAGGKKIPDQTRHDIMSDWASFSENCTADGLTDFSGLQSLVARTVPESGEALVLYEPRPTSFGLRIPLQMRILEPDYLDDTKNAILDNGGVIVAGVEFDRYLRRVAYWLFDDHPGEYFISRRGSLQSRRISAEWVDPVFNMLRPGQVRGMTWFAPVALKLHDIGDYEEAELVRKKIEACHVGFITRQTGAASQTQEGLKRDESGRVIETMSPGILLRGAPGEDVKFNNPSGTTGATEYLTQQLHAISAGLGLPYFMMSSDVSATNYSSARAAMLDFWDFLDHWQYNMMVPMMCRKAWQRFARYRTAGLGKSIDPTLNIVWTPPTRPFVDPVKDAEAAKAQVRSGFKTWRQVVSETGYDPDDILDECEDTNQRFDEKGLILDCDPRRVQASGKNQDKSKEEGAADAEK